jgi:DNA-binding transcriptional LysR family regulator
MNQLRHMSVFAHIVETGSITGAAESLQLSKSVVSQHLKALELGLGVTLLKRTTRRQTLTSAGVQFYEHCKALNTIADVAWREAQQALEVPQGIIRITAPNALMDTLVAPALGQLMQQYPLLKPELISSDQKIDLVSENIDLAIRVGQSKDSTIKQRRIGEFRDVLCSHQPPVNPQQKPADLGDTPYIANAWQGQHIEHAFKNKAGKTFLFTKKAQCRANSFYTCLTLIKSGAGIGLIPDFKLATQEATLFKVLPNYQMAPNPVYALYTYPKQLPLSLEVCLLAIEQQLMKTVKHL